jgi:hypothetical protein
MSGYPLYNFPVFDECRDGLMSKGFGVISPADMDRAVGFDPATGGADKTFLDAAMKRDVEAIMQVDFMVMLPGWRDSTGATAEYHLAKWRHIPVHEWTSMVDAFWETPSEEKKSAVAEAVRSAAREMFIGDPKAEAGSDKCPMHLLPPAALAQTAWVHGLGADKYGEWNWRETGIKFDTYVGAILRHLMLAHGGEWLDSESGLPHIAHIAASCNILLDADHCDKLKKYE